MKKKILFLALVTFANCMTAHGANIHLMALLGKKTSWEYLHDKLIEEPSRRVKTYSARNLNLRIMKALGSGTVFSFIMWFFTASKIQILEIEKNKCQQNEKKRVKLEKRIDQLSRKSIPWSIVFLSTILFNCFVMTPWTIWQSYFSLVRHAEKEIFLEMLRNSEETFKHAPKELIPVLQTAINRQEIAPALFENELPAFIDALKKEIHKNRASTTAFNTVR